MSRVILVEDNARLAALLEKSLLRVGIEVDIFSDIASTRQALPLCDYAVLILDRGLPDGDGLSLLRGMAQDAQRIPCIVLTARDALHDRIEGFDSGADDYLSKPFEMEEFIARVRALMRRPRQLQPQPTSFEDLRVAAETTSLHCGSAHTPVAPAEIQILLILMEARGATISRHKLEQTAWGIGKAVTPGALDVAIHRLRRKLEQLESCCQIDNIRGKGYALHAKNPA